MALNVSESIELNRLLRYLLNLDAVGGEAGVDGIDARECAVRLAEKASKALSAGLTGDDVRRLWAEHAPRPADCKRRKPR